MAGELEERFYTIRLFDAYGGLLTVRQQRLMRMYYLDDLSLGEIAERLHITRQAVRDSLQRSIEEVKRFEEHLALVRTRRKYRPPVRARAGSPPDADLSRRLRDLIRRLRKVAARAQSDDLRKITADLQALADREASGEGVGGRA